MNQKLCWWSFACRRFTSPEEWMWTISIITMVPSCISFRAQNTWGGFLRQSGACLWHFCWAIHEFWMCYWTTQIGTMAISCLENIGLTERWSRFLLTMLLVSERLVMELSAFVCLHSQVHSVHQECREKEPPVSFSCWLLRLFVLDKCAGSSCEDGRWKCV